ncbi:MAG TPA: hypothetical protein VK174_15055 [Chitinophagales bacterium]|nr:hypothetical protein [Chitinophagales bacterium]
MALTQKRKIVKSYADVLSEKMLDRIIMLVEKENEKPMAYSAKGEPISKVAALKILRRRTVEMETGKTISHDEVKKKFAKKRA